VIVQFVMLSVPRDAVRPAAIGHGRNGIRIEVRTPTSAAPGRNPASSWVPHAIRHSRTERRCARTAHRWPACCERTELPRLFLNIIMAIIKPGRGAPPFALLEL
jgi:hypothetical protein